VSFPPPGAALSTLTLNRHRLNVGEEAQLVAADSPDALEVVCEGRAIPFCEVRIAGDDGAALGDGRVGRVLIRGENVTKGYYEDPATSAAIISADGWLDTGDLGLVKGGDLYICGRAKDIIIVNGQNYYPHDLEALVQEAPGLELGKVVTAGAKTPGGETEQLVAFVLHRGEIADLVPIASELTRLINERSGLEVATVIPVKRIPKTTSGKVQRHLLVESYLSGELDAEVAQLAALRAAQRGGPDSGTRNEIEDKLKAICDTALEGRRVDLNDNLFEIGASSLKLIEIHEQIDREYPGQIELTELFDYPTIAQLALHLQSKLSPA
jgi:acyl carrier protein